MKTKLLKRLRKKYAIMGQTVHVIKYMYSVKPFHHYPQGEEFNPNWGSYSFDEAKAKQRELILKHVRKYQAAKGRYIATEIWKNITFLKYFWLKSNGYAVRKN